MDVGQSYMALVEGWQWRDGRGNEGRFGVVVFRIRSEVIIYQPKVRLE